MPIHVKNFFFVSWTWARVSLFFQLNKRVIPCESIIGSLTWSLETIPGAENRVWIQVRVFIEVAAVWFSFSTGLEEAGQGGVRQLGAWWTGGCLLVPLNSSESVRLARELRD
jgi:hypothetical protein